MFALSTSWNASSCNNGIDLIEQIQALGFKNVELSFNLTSKIVEDIHFLNKLGQIRVVSLHNFCPIPDNVERDKALPDFYSLSILDEKIRIKAVEQTKKTIDTAAQFKAGVVILHCGRVEIPDKTKALIELFNKGLKGSEGYEQLKLESIQERQKQDKPFLDQVLISLNELTEYARNCNVTLGIENRFYIHEIPNLEEIKVFLETFKDSNIAYWHDVGHAQVQENLGFNNQFEYLDLFRDRMIGMHLHDVDGTTDHLAPFEGKLDFSKFADYLKPDTLKVIESHSPATSQQIIKSVKILRQVFKDYD